MNKSNQQKRKYSQYFSIVLNSFGKYLKGCPQYPSKMETNLDSQEIKIIGNVLTKSRWDGNETVTKTREISVIIHHRSTRHLIWEFSHNSIYSRWSYELCEKHHNSVTCAVSMQSFGSPRLFRYRVYVNDRERSVLTRRGGLYCSKNSLFIFKIRLFRTFGWNYFHY